MAMDSVWLGWGGWRREEERMEKMTVVVGDVEKEVGTRSQRAREMYFPL